MRLFIAGITGLVIAGAPAYATPACGGLTKAEFENKVVEPSDLIIAGTVEDFSAEMQDKETGRFNKSFWTKIKPDIIFKGTLSATDITIDAWQAYQLPFYSYHKNDHLLLFLRGKGDHYQLTDGNWGECVPSVIGISVDPMQGKIRPLIRDLPQESKEYGMTLHAFRQYLLSK